MHDWVLGGQVVGEVKSVDGFTFVAVEAAGHMVPMNQPEVVSKFVAHYSSCSIIDEIILKLLKRIHW